MAGVISDETGSGALVFANTPTLVTPILGAATATSINKLTLTTPATGATLTLANNSSLITSGAFSVTLTSTATTSITLPTSGTLATLAGTESLTNKTLDNTNAVTLKTNSFTLQDSTTPTKQAIFSLSNITAANTRTITVPDVNTTLPIFSQICTFSGPTAARTYTLPDSSVTLASLSNTLGDFAATTSSQLASVISDETGSGALVFANSPSLVTPTLGAATATSINKVTISTPATAATLTLANNSTLATSGAFSTTLTATGTTNVTLPTTGTLATLAGSESLTNKTLDNTNSITIKDSNFTLQNSASTTKQAVFSLSNITAGQTRTVTIPDSNTTLPIISQAVTISGPTAARTYTFPDASCTVLTTNALVTVGQGGTGISSGTSGGIPYFSGTGTIASSALLTSNGVLLGGGSGASPTATAAGTAYQVFRVPSGGGAPAFGAIDLSQSAAVTGVLGTTNGGTGLSSVASFPYVADEVGSNTYTASSTGENTVYSYTIPANTLTANGSATVEAIIDLSTLTSSITFTVRCKIAGTTRASFVVSMTPSGTTASTCYIRFIFANKGATNVNCFSCVMYMCPGTGNNSTTGNAISPQLFSEPTLTHDTTSTVALLISVQASGNQSTTKYCCLNGKTIINK